MGREWAEQHILELIDARINIFKNQGGGGSNENPDDANVVSDYNYPFIITPGIGGSDVWLIENDYPTSVGTVCFAYSGAVAQQINKFPPVDNSFKNILPVGGWQSSDGAFLANLRKLSPLVSVPSGMNARGAVGLMTAHEDGGSHGNPRFECYHMSRLGYGSSNIESLMRTNLERFDSTHDSSPGNYYFLDHMSLSTTAFKINFYLVGQNAIIIIDGIVKHRRDSANITFSGINLGNNQIMMSSYYLAFSISINSFMTSFMNYLTDENINPGYSYIMISDAIFSPESVQLATGINTISTSYNEIITH